MKIQDIFKLNLNDRGGVKLFNKIMGRYNIPKADSKELINEVQNSSSGDGGVKEYYYKIIGDNQNLQAFAFVTGIYHCIAPIEENVYAKLYNVSGNRYWGLYDTRFLFDVRAFAITEDETIIYEVGRDNQAHEYSKVTFIPKGNVNEKIKKAAESHSVSYEEGMSLFNASFQEITKEEYESMITYKP